LLHRCSRRGDRSGTHASYAPVTRRKNGGALVMAYLAATAEVYDCDDVTVSFRAAAVVGS